MIDDCSMIRRFGIDAGHLGNWAKSERVQESKRQEESSNIQSASWRIGRLCGTGGGLTRGSDLDRQRRSLHLLQRRSLPDPVIAHRLTAS